jgi:AGZA family xanthine/uracil permease-like MFS transporter
MFAEVVMNGTCAQFLNRRFGLDERRTTVSTEVLAGVTTFMTMAYILAVNPSILSAAGMDAGAVFTATALSACLATVCMALTANLPFALAPGMGLNAFFAFTVAPVYGWQLALLAVFVEGVIFILLSCVNAREAIFNAIPQTLKYSVSVGIGLFICFIGLKSGGIVVSAPATTVTLGNLGRVTTLLCIFGLVATVVMCIKKVKGALLWGILLTYALGICCQAAGLYLPDPKAGMYSLYPTNAAGDIALVSLPPSLAKCNLISVWAGGSMPSVPLLDFIPIVFAFLFVDVFDTIGTLIGVSGKAGLLDQDGRLPQLKPALFSDAIGTTLGAVMGTSTVTTFVESAAGVAEGGRTGLTSLTCAALFLAALFLSPVFGAIPAFATAPALIVVGLFMIESITKINFADFEEAFPAFICIVMMPFAYSISDGLVFGVLSYVLVKILCGGAGKVSLVMYGIAALFLLKLIAA